VPLGAYLALQIPALQTFAANKAAKNLSGRLNTEVSIGRVYYVFFNRLIANDILIKYNDTDTLFGCKKLSVRFSAGDLLRNKIRLNHLHLYDGVIKIVNETDSTTNLSRILSLIPKSEKRDTTKKSANIFARELIIDNFRFTLSNPFSQDGLRDSTYVNFKDLSLSKINFNLRNISYMGDVLKAEIKNISFEDKSGFRTEKLEGNLTLEPHKINIQNIIINDGLSFLKGEHLSFSYDSLSDFNDFVNKVVIDVHFENSLLNFRTISKFTPSLKSNMLKLYITGNISGSISNIRTQNLKITSESGLTYVDLNARISGLPNPDVTMAFVDINNSVTTTTDLAYIISSLNSTKPMKLLTQLSPLVRYNFKGRLAGLLDDFVANGHLNTNIGQLYVDVLLRNNFKEKGLDLLGNLRSQNFNVGSLIKSSTIGELTLNTHVSALLRDENLGGSRFLIDSMFIQKLHFNGYPYSNITAVGSYTNNTFDGKVICRDPNLDFLFQGIIGMSTGRNSYYDFYADIIYADLAALNFDKRDSVSSVSLRTLANFTQDKKGDIEGTINIRNLNFRNSKGAFPIGDINIQSSSAQDNFSIYLKSSFATATYKGTDFFTNFINKFFNVTLADNLPAVFPNLMGDGPRVKGKNYSFNIDFNDTRSIAQLILPGLQIASKTSVKVTIDAKDNIKLFLKSDKLGYNNIYGDKINLNIQGNSESVTAQIESDRIHIGGLNLDSSKVFLGLKDNLFSVKSEYTNSGDLENRLDFTSEVLFTSMGEGNPAIMDLSINPSEIYLNGVNWAIGKSKIVFQDSTYVFHDFNLSRENQLLNVDGMISRNPYDTLSVIIKNLDITPFNSLLNLPLHLQGVFNGNAIAVNMHNNPKILFDIKGDSVSLNHHYFGNLEINSEWDNSESSFKLSLLNRLNDSIPLKATGFYNPADNFLSINANLNNLQPKYFESFLKDIVSETAGGVTGNLVLSGKTDKLNLTGRNVMLNNLAFKVDFTNVFYTLNGPVNLTETGLYLNNAIIRDRAGNSGRVNGGLQYRHFRDLRLSTTVTFTNLEALNTREEDNSSFYGTAFGTGRLSISGPLDKILMDINVTTNRNTSIHIPLSSATEVSSNNLLTFIQPAAELYSNDPTNSVNAKLKSGTELHVKLRANMTPDAAMLIEIDKTVGDIITGYGSGLITLDINPSKDIFNMQGDYIIQSGFYKFVLQGIFERDFTIQEGGNIGFNGNIDRTNLNITANYRTKASINTLIADTSSVSNRRTVDCQINMSGNLMNPNLKFAIDIPDIDPVTKSRVNAALNTDDKVVKQVMSLLISGSFIPDVQSSIVNNSTILYSNATEVLSNQINKIFNQLDIPLDLSFNYQPGQNGRNMFDAAVSAQLFNNRVILNGNIGSSKYMNKAGEVVGDLDVEIKLDDKGRFRAKAFSHSADQYSNYLDNSQRNGVGLVYQEEFSSFRELFNRMFSGKKKRETTLPDNSPARKEDQDFPEESDSVSLLQLR
jgi:hypothetical protein